MDYEVPGSAAGETTFAAVEHNESGDAERGAHRSREQRISPAVETMTEFTSQTPAAASEAENHAVENHEDNHELDALMGKAFESKPIWTDLYENIRDVFFPKKLPPLELTSKPIPVADPMAVKANPWSYGTAAVVNCGIIALILFLGARQVIRHIEQPVKVSNVDISDFKLSAPKTSVAAGGGGGGGSHDVVPAIKGRLPKIEKQPMVPPMVPVIEKPKLAIDSAIAVQKNIKLPDNPNLPNIGVTNSPNVTLASNGTGGGSGMGSGSGGGLGSGSGNGYGPGSGGNAGGGVFRIGGGVSEPQVIYAPEAEFSDEARRAKYQGEVMVRIIVDTQGNVQDARIVRPLGMGLDEKALEAVRQYKFRPARKDGRPVPVYMTVAVNFRLY